MKYPNKLFTAKIGNDISPRIYGVYELLTALEKQNIKRSLGWAYSLPLMKLKVLDGNYIIKSTYEGDNDYVKKWNDAKALIEAQL